MEVEDDWDLSAEELYSLERDAVENLSTSLKSAGSSQDEPSKELPKLSVDFFLRASGSVAAKFQYDQVVVAAIRRIRRASRYAKGSSTLNLSSSSPNKSGVKAEALKFTQKNLINKIYTDSAEAKIPSVLDYVGTMIEAGCKFLIFAHHQPMIDSIQKFLLKKKEGCIRIYGSTPAASRQQLVTEFQEKDAIKAAVLTAASTVIFAELSRTPGDLIQAEDHAHRVGQMLDGHENILEVSTNQPGNSTAKQKTLEKTFDHSPAKQKTIDEFGRRCDCRDESEHQSNPKGPRHCPLSSSKW